jgi:predicted ATPase
MPHLPPELSLRSLGRHRFKDLGDAEDVYQLDVDGLRTEFPVLRTLELASHNLPVQLTSFIGRGELAQVTNLLANSRLVTLTGPGGTGKTRLSLQAGAEEVGRHRDGVWFVELGPVTDPALVTTEVAATLSFQLSDQDPDQRLSEHLRSKQMLLILDNFEQVLDAAPSVSVWLRGAPELKALVTSRAPLRITGEQEFPVPPLALPDPSADVAALTDNEAVSLFIERARAARPDFMLDAENAGSIARIVARLDGLPLAIELAAARLRLLSIDAIAQRLESRLGLLTGGARDRPERQRTLRGAIEWSFDLLSSDLQDLFAQLGIFVGGFTLNETEKIIGMDGAMDLLESIATLADQSLLKPIVNAVTPRFLMLETIREFAIEKMAQLPDYSALQRRHAETYLGLVEEAAQHFLTDEQRTWLDRISDEHDNVRAALDYAGETADVEMAQRLCGAMWRFWQMRGFLTEGRTRTTAALTAGPGSPQSRLRALDAAGGLAYWQADADSAREFYREQVALARSLGDKRELGFALFNYGSSINIGRSDFQLEPIEEAVTLAEEVGDPTLLGSVYWGLGSMHYLRTADNDPDRAQHLEQAIAAFHRAAEHLQGSASSFQIGWNHNMLAFSLLADQRPEEAITHLRAGLRLFVDAGDLSALPLQVASFAEYALQIGNQELGLVLAGAAATLQDASDTNLLEISANEVRGVRAVISRLGAEAVEPYLARGRAMTTADVLEAVGQL